MSNSVYKYDFSHANTDDDDGIDEYRDNDRRRSSSLPLGRHDADEPYRRWQDVVSSTDDPEIISNDDESSSSSSQQLLRPCRICYQYVGHSVLSLWILIRPRGRMTMERIENSSHRYQTTETDLLKRLFVKLRTFSFFSLCMSLFFWVWAIQNTLQMQRGQDLGMYSFASVILTSLWVLGRSYRGPSPPVMINAQQRPQHGGLSSSASKRHYTTVATLPIRICVTASHLLVCFNYMLGILFALTVGESAYRWFATYCVIFTMLWGYVSFHGCQVLSRVNKAEQEYVKEEEEYLMYGHGDDGNNNGDATDDYLLEAALAR